MCVVYYIYIICEYPFIDISVKYTMHTLACIRSSHLEPYPRDVLTTS